MKSSSENHPKFSNPPVVEVYCRQIFKKLSSLQAPHIGLFWNLVKKDFPKIKEKPYLPPQVESYDVPPKPKEVFLELPSLPRTWFVSKNENEILQVQSDQFLINWRKLDPQDRYPHYDEIIEKFFKYSNCFEKFVSEENLGEIACNQFELTYVNHITSSNGGGSGVLLEEIFPDFKTGSEGKKFLPNTESVNWTNTYLLPNQEGRLYSTIRSAWHKEHQNEPIIQFQLSVRGVGKDLSPTGIRKWFDQAHDWIVLPFADLTSEQVQNKYWGRSDND